MCMYYILITGSRHFEANLYPRTKKTDLYHSNYRLVCPPTTIHFIRSDYTPVQTQTDLALCILKRRSLLDIREVKP